MTWNPSPDRIAKKRPTRTRTKHVSSAPALVASQMRPNEIDPRPRAMTVVCPDCRTWCPITGQTSRTPKLVPHHTGRAGSAEARRCQGSNRRIILDLPLEWWEWKKGEAHRDSAPRTATTVMPRPKPKPTPAASQIEAPLLNLDAARDTHLTHRARCAACKGRNYCTDGLRLADLYVRLLRQEPERSRRRELLAEVTADQEQQTARQFPRARAKEWKRVDLAVRRTDEARDRRPASAAPDQHTTVPLIPPRIAV